MKIMSWAFLGLYLVIGSLTVNAQQEIDVCDLDSWKKYEKLDYSLSEINTMYDISARLCDRFKSGELSYDLAKKYFYVEFLRTVYCENGRLKTKRKSALGEVLTETYTLYCIRCAQNPDNIITHLESSLTDWFCIKAKYFSYRLKKIGRP